MYMKVNDMKIKQKVMVNTFMLMELLILVNEKTINNMEKGPKHDLMAQNMLGHIKMRINMEKDSLFVFDII